MVHVNTSFRADKSSAIYRSLENFSNSIVSTGKVVSMPHLETGAILIDATEMFLTDVSYVSQNRKGQYRFDKKNSLSENLKPEIRIYDNPQTLTYEASIQTNFFRDYYFGRLVK